MPATEVAVPLDPAFYTAWQREDFRAQLLTILKDEKIEAEDPRAVVYDPKFSDMPGPRNVQYILVSVKKESEGDVEKWIKAAERILDLLKNNYLDHVNISIADERAFFETVSKVLEGTDLIVKHWPDVESKVLESLEPNKQWISLNVLRRGKLDLAGNESNEFPFRPTVVIVIEYESNEDWSNVNDRVIKVLDDTFAGEHCVEILRSRGASTLFTGTPPPRNVSHTTDLAKESAFGRYGNVLWEEVVFIGSSIGPQAAESSGTFACYLRIKENGGTSKVVGLTNFHITDSPSTHKDMTGKEDPTYGKTAAEATWIQAGGRANGNGRIMSAPSALDHNQAMTECRKNIGAIFNDPDFATPRAKVAEFENDPDIAEGLPLKEFVGPRYGHYLRQRKLLSIHQESQSIGRACEARGHVFGTVWGASGLRRDTETDLMMDWALLEVDTKRTSTNSLNNRAAWIQNRFAGVDLKDSAKTTPDVVHKFGRTTKIHQRKDEPSASTPQSSLLQRTYRRAERQRRQSYGSHY